VQILRKTDAKYLTSPNRSLRYSCTRLRPHVSGCRHVQHHPRGVPVARRRPAGRRHVLGRHRRPPRLRCRRTPAAHPRRRPRLPQAPRRRSTERRRRGVRRGHVHPAQTPPHRRRQGRRQGRRLPRPHLDDYPPPPPQGRRRGPQGAPAADRRRTPQGGRGVFGVQEAVRVARGAGAHLRPAGQRRVREEVRLPPGRAAGRAPRPRPRFRQGLVRPALMVPRHRPAAGGSATPGPRTERPFRRTPRRSG